MLRFFPSERSIAVRLSCSMIAGVRYILLLFLRESRRTNVLIYIINIMCIYVKFPLIT
jgi:hypothetical protein